MKSVFQSLVLGAGASLAVAGSASASSLLNITVEASTTGVDGTYSSVLAVSPAAASTLYFEVFAQSAAPTTTNPNTVKTPNGTTDSLVALPNFTLASTGAIFASSSLDSMFNTGSGNSAGTTGSSSLDIRAIEQGFTENDDSALLIDSGTLTLGSSFAGIVASTDLPVVNAGSIRVSGSPVAITQTSESGANPYIGYTGVTVAGATSTPVPLPSGAMAGSVLLSGLGGMSLLARRKANSAV